MTLGGQEIAGRKLKSKSGWGFFNGSNGNGASIGGFSAYPGGSRKSDGSFSELDYIYWWSSDLNNDNLPLCWGLVNFGGDAKPDNALERPVFGKDDGFYIRLIKE
jgi:uncharacterized protein (TIGR02145 family)